MRKIQKKAAPGHFIKWKNDFRKNHGREPVYDDLIGTAEYVAVKKELLEEQGYICCYCEKEIGVRANNDCDIEHFMPRNPDKRMLTFDECRKCRDAQMDYDNLFVSCKGEEQYSLDHCNHKKDNWFDFQHCISPASEEVQGIFGFRVSGKMVALNGNPSAEEMIKHLNLNTYILQEQRKNAYDAVLEAEFDDDELIGDDIYLLETIAEYKEKDENGRHVPFCSMITYCLTNYY